MVSQLRQDNTELRHRLRHGGTAAPAPVSAMNTELANTNAKLRKQVEGLKKEVGESSQVLEKVRLESAKEVAKWKLRIGTSPAPRSPHSAGGDAVMGDLRDLRRRLAVAEKDLRYERLLNTGTRRSGSAGGRGTHGTPGAPPRGDSPRWMGSTARSGRGLGGGLGGGMGADGRRYRSPSGSYPSSVGNYSTSHSYSQRDRPASAVGRSAPPRSTSPGTYGQTRRPATAGADRESSPGLRPRASPANNSNNTNGNGLSSSLGGRFDPTAYQREKAERERRAKGGRAWGAGVGSGEGEQGKYRYASPSAGESGYASANSQVCSRQQTVGRRQQTVGSR
jgi:hypothetical protein